MAGDPFWHGAPIEAHGVIGDRRTAALVAADGTIDWLCLPDFDGEVRLGALLDPARGGFWRLGPTAVRPGEQRYPGDAAVLETRWALPGGTLVLTDFMPAPGDHRPAGTEAARVVVRRLRCEAGAASAVHRLDARADFGPGEAPALWFDGARPARSGEPFELTEGQEVWAVWAHGDAREAWTPARCEAALAETLAYWARAPRGGEGPIAAMVSRSRMVLELLAYAPTGAPVAAVTASLPERLGGPLNWDYRYCWVRDAAIAATAQLMLGDATPARRLLDFLVPLPGKDDMPLRVCYRLDGGTEMPVRQRDDLAGYQGSRPVQFGNRAADQFQLDSPGYLADLIARYHEAGAPWREAYGDLLRRLADHVAARWQAPDAGIWELAEPARFTSSRVMSWVTLDRAGRLLGPGRWADACEALRRAVLEEGWSEELGAFRQAFGRENLDASVLLAGLMGLVAPDDQRFVRTVDTLAGRLLAPEGLYRFDPAATPGVPAMPLGAYEGVFTPCTCWLAWALALVGRRDEGVRLLADLARRAGPLGLLSEELAPGTGAFLGNMPQAFSHAEFVRAAIACQVAGRSSQPPRNPAR